MKYAISNSYNSTTVGYVKFPEGKTWNDVDDWYVKWDSGEIIDWKRPSSTSVHPTDEEGNPDYNEELAERY